MIDPSAFIAPGAIVLGDVHLGVESSVWYNAVLRGDTDRITIGDRTNIQDLTMIHADPGVPCTVGSRVTVGHRVILHGCTIEDDCLIGMGAIILNRRPRRPRLDRRRRRRAARRDGGPPGLAGRRPAGEGRATRGRGRGEAASNTAGGITSTRPGGIGTGRSRSSRQPTGPRRQSTPSADESSRSLRSLSTGRARAGSCRRSPRAWHRARDDASRAPSPSRRTPRSPRRRTRPDSWRHRDRGPLPSQGAVAPEPLVLVLHDDDSTTGTARDREELRGAVGRAVFHIEDVGELVQDQVAAGVATLDRLRKSSHETTATPSFHASPSRTCIPSR